MRSASEFERDVKMATVQIKKSSQATLAGSAGVSSM
jgi:hypothetical protein